MNTAPSTPAPTLLSACEDVRSTYQMSGDSAAWVTSPYKWLRDLSSRKKGAAGEKIIEKWLTANGCEITLTGNSQSDRVVNGCSVEIKLSTEWENGIYKFQQIRDQNYKFIVLFGIRPQELHVWCVPKDVILAHSIGQHTGGGAQETKWISFSTNAIPDWLHSYGGESAVGLAKILASMPKECDDL